MQDPEWERVRSPAGNDWQIVQLLLYRNRRKLMIGLQQG